jgi:DeoR/GlpR family transcriptional regulator of sugar metabolism
LSADGTVAARAIAPRRHGEILKQLAADGAISVEEMAVRFSVSRETIRRDLKTLAGRGQLAIVHGGATRRADEPTLAVREEDNPYGKAAIGRRAAGLVEDGMVVLLDSGSTTMAVAQVLAAPDLGPWKGLTVCTNSLSIGLVLCRVPGIRLHLFGGEVTGSDEAAFGPDGFAALARFRADLAFIGVGGVSPAGDLTDFAVSPAEFRSAMLCAADRGYIVVDQTKFGRLTPIRLRPVPAGTHLIVDAAPSAPITSALAARGIEILVAE